MISKVTEYEQEILKLWEEGLTGAQIGEKLSMTRGAVMGKLHRLREQKVIGYKNIAKRTAAVRHKVREKERAKEETVEPVEEKPLIEAVEELLPLIMEELKPQYAERKLVKLMDLSPSSCRYIVSGYYPKDFLFCNEVKKLNSSYCEEHHAICHYPNVITRKKATQDDATA